MTRSTERCNNVSCREREWKMKGRVYKIRPSIIQNLNNHATKIQSLENDSKIALKEIFNFQIMTLKHS